MQPIGGPMKEIRKKAKEQMKGYCRVCPVCNGVACAGEVPGMGGLGTASSFKANVAALAAAIAESGGAEAQE